MCVFLFSFCVAMTASRMLTSEHMITILCVFFALVAAMCASIVVTCRNKIRDRRRKKREYKLARRSKEVSVEVLGLEAALAAQAAEIGAARGRKPGWDVDDGNCYVPEVSCFGTALDTIHTVNSA